MSDEKDFCDQCGTMFGNGVSNSKCTFYTENNYVMFICVSCFEDLGGYSETEQYRRYNNFVKENKNVQNV